MKAVKNIIRTESRELLAIGDDGTTQRISAEDLAQYVAAFPNSTIPEENRREIGYLLSRIESEKKQAKNDNENRERCKNIVDELEEIASGNIYKCPKCGELITYDNDQESENEEGETVYTCQECGETFEENELDAVSMFDYFDDVYNIDYTIGSEREYKSVCIMVACGGPNIYIDTGAREVVLRWWGDKASYQISSEAAAAIDEVFEEYYNN